MRGRAFVDVWQAPRASTHDFSEQGSRHERLPFLFDDPCISTCYLFLELRWMLILMLLPGYEGRELKVAQVGQRHVWYHLCWEKVSSVIKPRGGSADTMIVLQTNSIAKNAIRNDSAPRCSWRRLCSLQCRDRMKSELAYHTLRNVRDGFTFSENVCNTSRAAIWNLMVFSFQPRKRAKDAPGACVPCKRSFAIG